MVQEIVQNMLVYVVMVTILKGLVSNKGFLEMFRFVSGLILILLFISPMLSVLSLDTGWYQRLEENIFQIDKQQLEQEMRVADGGFEKVLLEECESQVEQQIQKLARENGQTAQEVEVSLEAGEDGEWFVQRVRMTIGQEVKETMGRSDGEGASSGDNREDGAGRIEQIPDIVIEPRQPEAEQSSQGFLEDGDTRRLKKKICREYQLPEEVVDVWKKNGEN